jgi:NADPH2:quinone reductase
MVPVMPVEQVRALVVTRHGGAEVLQVQQRSLPDPGPDEMRVAVAASGVNFVDVYQRQGVYRTSPPFVLGAEGAGSVVAVGAAVSDFRIGDTVAWADAPASHASEVNVPANKAVPVPPEVPVEIAAAAMLQGMTAHYLANSTYPVQPGDVALVHAAAGGVGQLLVQMIKHRGGHVIGTVSTAQKEIKARAVGADEVIRYTEVPDLAAQVRHLNGERGVRVVYDGVGRVTFEASLSSLAPRGMLVVFGGSSGQVPPFDVQRLNSGGSLFLTRPTLVHYTATREELLWRSSDVLNALAAGRLHIEIGGRYPLDQAARVYDDLESRRTTGKLLLIP